MREVRSGARKKIDPAITPLVLLVVDELAELDKGQLEKLRSIVSLGRAAGVVTIAATQRPSAELVSGDLRALFRATATFALRSARDVNVVLGDGIAKDLEEAHGHDAAKLPARNLWLRGETDATARRVRVFTLGDAERSALAAKATLVLPEGGTGEPAEEGGDPENAQPIGSDAGPPLPPSPPADVTATQAAVIECLLAAEGPLSGAQVAVRLGVDPAQARRTLRRLEGLGRVRNEGTDTAPAWVVVGAWAGAA
jgi:hypothetical protein